MLTERIIRTHGRARSAMEDFLRSNGLGLDGDVEYSYCLMDGVRFAAAGSLSGPVLKCIAVDEAYRALGLGARVVSGLAREAAENGHTHLFLFTKPENLPLFEGLGFFPVVSCEKAVLLENTPDGLAVYLRSLAGLRAKGVSGAAVLNANPFTLGHLHLARVAAAQVDHLHLFVVGEDRSDIPAADREALVREGVLGIDNVTVHSGTPYVISAATFPTYFLKTADEAARAYARLDLTLFGRYIAPALGVSVRFAGEEPLSPATLLYNQAMQEVLAPLGVSVRIIPRLTWGGEVVSASRVRALWRAGDFVHIAPLVPPATLSYLQSRPAPD